MANLVVDIPRHDRKDKRSLSLILERSESSDCAKPVDRIYSILGIVPEFVRWALPAECSEQSRCEYWKLWALAAKLALQANGHWEVLYTGGL